MSSTFEVAMAVKHENDQKKGLSTLRPFDSNRIY